MTREVIYQASPTLSRLHRSNAFVRGIRGPVGSGKSTGMCWEIMRRAREQKPGPDGIRRTRWAVVRNTYRELNDTTLKTWLDWFPEDIFGAFHHGNMIHHIQHEDLDAEVLFRALDRPDDAKKILSLELTGAWVNETREVPKGIIDILGDRVGRYPAMRKGGPTWRGVLLDTNAPDDDHWWYRLAEEERPDGWEFYAQPPGLIEVEGKWRTNPDAENLENLEPDYYETRAAGKTRDYIKVYYCNEYGFVQEGKPIYPEYIDHVHCSQEILEPIPGRTLYVGIDFGLTPAAVFGQSTVAGQWRWIDELVTEDMGAVQFAEVLGPVLRNRYAGYEVEIYGDPAGDDRAQTDKTTPFEILRARGIDAWPAPSNDPVLRREAVAIALTRMVEGEPGLLISPKCKITRKGMAGGYAYKRVQVAGDERYHDKPNKNRFSHPCEAGQYMMLGAGEGQSVIPGRDTAEDDRKLAAYNEDLASVQSWTSRSLREGKVAFGGIYRAPRN